MSQNYSSWRNAAALTIKGMELSLILVSIRHHFQTMHWPRLRLPKEKMDTSHQQGKQNGRCSTTQTRPLRRRNQVAILFVLI